MDFCYGYVQFPSLYVSLPGGLSFDVKKYWNGQPVKYTCCERNKGTGKGPGRIFYCVVFELLEDEEDEDEEQVPVHNLSNDID